VKRRGTLAILAAAVFVLAAWATASLAPAAVFRGSAASSRAGCSASGDPAVSTHAQERAMLCLVNRARRGRGLAPLATVASLQRAAGRKSAEILRCDEFSHEACGRQFTYWMTHFGYSGCREGENIAWESGPYSTPREIFSLWMHSSGHRSNILGPYRETGIGLRVGTLEGYGGAHVWTQEFGSRSC
jgi:uncharacterized protein YkwD